MVEAAPQGDGIRRHVTYGKWRDDKEAEPGYSRELVSIGTEPKYYDDLISQPFLKETENLSTIMECFKNQV